MAQNWRFPPADVDGLIFISYNSSDYQRVSAIAYEMNQLGLPVWYDYGLHASQDEWHAQITEHIRKASAVIIFVTKGIAERTDSYVIEEYVEARQCQCAIIPVFLDDVTNPAFLNNIQPKYVRYINEWNRLQSIPYPAPTSPQMTAMSIKSLIDRSKRSFDSGVSRSSTSGAGLNRNTSYDSGNSNTVSRHGNKNNVIIAALSVIIIGLLIAVIIILLPGSPKQQDNPPTNGGGNYEVSVADIDNIQNINSVSCLDAGDYSVGGYMYFGTYEQDNNRSNGEENIRWRVLSIESDKMLVISEKILVAKPFNVDFMQITWENCTLKEWMNNDFINEAFSEEEQNYIVPVTHETGDNEKYGISGGSATTDSVFCLSYDELDSYFGDDRDRISEGTKYAKDRDLKVWTNEKSWWWLRTPGGNSGRNAMIVDPGGVTEVVGAYVKKKEIGVRPAMYLRIA